MTFAFNVAIRAEDVPKAEKPKTAGRPVFLASGKAIVFPEGMEEPAKNYKGALGGNRPLAVITIDGKPAGEIYSSRLQKSAAKEAKGMAGSVDKEGVITLLHQGTIQDDGQDVQVVTLRLNVDTQLGKPVLIHSLYFPLGDSSTTFKLVANEMQFKLVQPYFETMLFFGRKDREGK
jgi:hypothetical protein